jgi:hypothetical protein
MDDKIKAEKRKIDKGMNKLLKEDQKRDKACGAKCGAAKKSKGMK